MSLQCSSKLIVASVWFNSFLVRSCSIAFVSSLHSHTLELLAVSAIESLFLFFSTLTWAAFNLSLLSLRRQIKMKSRAVVTRQYIKYAKGEANTGCFTLICNDDTGPGDLLATSYLLTKKVYFPGFN